MKEKMLTGCGHRDERLIDEGEESLRGRCLVWSLVLKVEKEVKR